MPAWDCHGSLGGCHPHGHHVGTTLHSTYGPLGILLFAALIGLLYDLKQGR